MDQLVPVVPWLSLQVFGGDEGCGARHDGCSLHGILPSSSATVVPRGSSSEIGQERRLACSNCHPRGGRRSQFLDLVLHVSRGRLERRLPNVRSARRTRPRIHAARDPTRPRSAPGPAAFPLRSDSAASATRMAPVAAPASPNVSAGCSITMSGEKKSPCLKPRNAPQLGVEVLAVEAGKRRRDRPGQWWQALSQLRRARPPDPSPFAGASPYRWPGSIADAAPCTTTRAPCGSADRRLTTARRTRRLRRG